MGFAILVCTFETNIEFLGSVLERTSVKSMRITQALENMPCTLNWKAQLSVSKRKLKGDLMVFYKKLHGAIDYFNSGGKKGDMGYLQML